MPFISKDIVHKSFWADFTLNFWTLQTFMSVFLWLSLIFRVIMENTSFVTCKIMVKKVITLFMVMFQNFFAHVSSSFLSWVYSEHISHKLFETWTHSWWFGSPFPSKFPWDNQFSCCVIRQYSQINLSILWTLSSVTVVFGWPDLIKLEIWNSTRFTFFSFTTYL